MRQTSQMPSSSKPQWSPRAGRSIARGYSLFPPQWREVRQATAAGMTLSRHHDAVPVARRLACYECRPSLRTVAEHYSIAAVRLLPRWCGEPGSNWGLTPVTLPQRSAAFGLTHLDSVRNLIRRAERALLGSLCSTTGSRRPAHGSSKPRVAATCRRGRKAMTSQCTQFSGVRRLGAAFRPADVSADAKSSDKSPKEKAMTSHRTPNAQNGATQLGERSGLGQIRASGYTVLLPSGRSSRSVSAGTWGNGGGTGPTIIGGPSASRFLLTAAAPVARYDGWPRSSRSSVHPGSS